MKNNTKINVFREEARQFMSENGLSNDGELISDGKIYRYSADEKRNKRDEWYVAFEGITHKGNPFFICIFGSWSEGSKYEYKSFQNSDLNEDEKREFLKILQEKRDEADRQRGVSYDQAAQKALSLWNTYSDQAPSNQYTRYLQIKGIPGVGNIKYGTTRNGYSSIIIPLHNSNNEIRSLQYIFTLEDESVQKRFFPGGETRGNFFILGDISDDKVLYVVEGYATGVSVYQATNMPVVVTFSLWNIENVIRVIQAKLSINKIIIAADKDKPGKTHSSNEVNAIALQLGCALIFPEFSREAPDDLKDFNDLHQYAGLDEVKKQLLQKDSANHLKKLAENYLLDQEEPCESFKLSALPIPLREYIAVICKTTNAHPIMVTSSVLTMMSAFLGTKVFIPSNEYFQDLYPNLWILCIAKSGQFKTTALNKGAKISFDKQSQVFKAIKELQSGSAMGQVEEEVLKKSLENIVLPTKQTAEGFLEYLSQGHQGAIYASEFGGWLQNLDKTHNNDFKAILTEFYDVPSYYRYKTKTQGDCIIETPYISICGVSTMPWIRTNLKPSDIPSGFFARFLIFVPPYQGGIPPAFPTSLENLYVKEEEKFKNFLDEILNYIGESRSFHFTQEARGLIESLHNYIYLMPKKYSERANEILEPYLKRWSPYLFKLSMIMQLFIDPKTKQIDKPAIISAWSILIPAMKSTASLFEGELGESKHQRKCRIIFEFICKKTKETGKPIKRKAILSSKKLDGGGKEYDEILQTLIDQGKIRYHELKPKNESEYSLVEEIERI